MQRFSSGVCVLAVFALAVPVFGQTSKSAAAPASSSSEQMAPGPANRPKPVILPGTPNRAFSMVRGNALDASGRALTAARVRLRDARSGQSANLQVTDKSGLFAFETVDPGIYVVEILGPSNSVLAASELLRPLAGEVVSVVVKLPLRTVSGWPFGRTTAQALAILSAASATGVLTMSATTDVSPEGPPR